MPVCLICKRQLHAFARFAIVLPCSAGVSTRLTNIMALFRGDKIYSANNKNMNLCVTGSDISYMGSMALPWPIVSMYGNIRDNCPIIRDWSNNSGAGCARMDGSSLDGPGPVAALFDACLSAWQECENALCPIMRAVTALDKKYIVPTYRANFIIIFF